MQNILVVIVHFSNDTASRVFCVHVHSLAYSLPLIVSSDITV